MEAIDLRIDGLGPHRDDVERALDDLDRERVVPRIWDRDATVWGAGTEAAERLGWLDAPTPRAGRLEPAERLVEEAPAEGLSRALLVGMGGSSLAPEVFARTLGSAAGGLDLEVLDSTDPAAVRAAADRHDPRTTLHVVSSKSGTTVETLSLFRYFLARARESIGEAAGERFVAITDPGSPLAETAAGHGFRVVFLGDPAVGGRYSALTPFGLVPATLVGVGTDELLARGRDAAEACRAPLARDNPGARLGATLAALAAAGRDKATFVAAPPVAPFADWVEQLLAESTGKGGRGIVPVVGEPLANPDRYRGDRVFVHLAPGQDRAAGDRLAGLAEVGHPVVRVGLDVRRDLGAHFFLWSFATAIAGRVLGVDPFDQPDVEAAKAAAREALDDYRREGRLAEPEPAARADGVAVFVDRAPGGAGKDPLEAAAEAVVEAARTGAYVAIQAWLPPTPAVDAALGSLRAALRGRTRVATTVGYGPRYLHSTGQLHKGDAGGGVFVQVTAEPDEDVPIPAGPGEAGSGVSFGTLERAQALGDARALRAAGRRVTRFHLEGGPETGLRRLAAAFGG